MKKLIKSYRFWTALAGSTGLLVVSTAKIFGVTISSTAVEDFIMAICGVLVVLGIVKKPKIKEEPKPKKSSAKKKKKKKEVETEKPKKETKKTKSKK